MISTLATFPPFLHKDIIEYLSTSFLPMAICEYNQLFSDPVIIKKVLQIKQNLYIQYELSGGYHSSFSV